MLATLSPDLGPAPWYVWAFMVIAALILWAFVVAGIVRWMRQATEHPYPKPPKAARTVSTGLRLRVEHCWQCGGTSIHHKANCRRSLDREGL